MACFFQSMMQAKGWFKTGGTTEITDNFVPVDVMVVGFMIFGRMKA